MLMNKPSVENYVELINAQIAKSVPECTCGVSVVHEAMKYSLSAGGKRIRPMLVLEFCRLCGGDIGDAMPFACAIEFIHTYSLIHDDLPCMDDDDMRRGRPSCHKQFGEAFALLAGDALLTCAFEKCTNSELIHKNPLAVVKAVRLLSELAGANGMIGGQTVDLSSENKAVDVDTLLVMDKLKTGALIKAACLLGCTAADADNEKCEAASLFAEKLGLAFQVVDDILDVEGDTALLGKQAGSDAKSGKSTYVTALGIDEAKKYADKLTNEAIDALSVFGYDADFLRELATSLISRKF